MDTYAVSQEMNEAAAKAGQEYLDKHYDGKDWGACGFAWVTLCPRYKGNTKAGKEERKLFAQLGFEKDWTGKTYMRWNPSGLGCQNVDAKEAGARAAAKVLQAHGLQAYAGSRLD